MQVSAVERPLIGALYRHSCSVHASTDRFLKGVYIKAEVGSDLRCIVHGMHYVRLLSFAAVTVDNIKFVSEIGVVLIVQ